MRIIAGEWGGRTIRAPAGRDVRPTTDRVREAWMSALAPWLPGARVLDLFAGSGALGLECLSRGASRVVFVEQARPALTVLRDNIAMLGGDDRAHVVPKEVFRFLEGERGPPSIGDDPLQGAVSGSPRPFDIAVADPPYDRGFAARLLTHFERKPFASQLWIEHSVSEAIPDTGLRQRRYGDTILTTAFAPEPEPPSSPPDDRSTP